MHMLTAFYTLLNDLKNTMKQAVRQKGTQILAKQNLPSWHSSHIPKPQN